MIDVEETSQFSPSSLPKLRPLGRLERFLAIWHHLSLYNNVGTTAIYNPPPTFSPEAIRPTVYAALSYLIQHHPVLSAIPVDEGSKNCYFGRLPSINLSRCVQFVSRSTPWPVMRGTGARDEELERLMEDQHNRCFDWNSGAPAWRVVVLSSPAERPGSEKPHFSVSWVYHHCIGDGISGVAFQKAFLEALNNGPLSPEDNAVVKPPDLPLLPTLEELHKLPLSACYLLRTVKDEVLPARGMWAGHASMTRDKRHRFRAITLPVGPFLDACRREKTTVTATLCALVAKSLFGTFTQDELKRTTKLRCTFPVSMRRWLPGIDDDMIGVWVTAYDKRIPKSTLDWWENARECKDKLQRCVDARGKDGQTSQMKLVPSGGYRKYVESREGKSPEFSFEVSNLGAFKNPGEGGRGWSVERLVFSQSAKIGAALEVSAVSVAGGDIVVGVAWQEDVVEEPFVHSFCSKLEEEIRDA